MFKTNFCRRNKIWGAQKYLEGHCPLWLRARARSSLAPPCSNLSFFGSKYTVLKIVLVKLLGLFSVPAVIRRPHSDAMPKELFPLSPSLRPWWRHAHMVECSFLEQWSQPFCNRRPANAWQIYDPRVLYVGCYFSTAENKLSV